MARKTRGTRANGTGEPVVELNALSDLPRPLPPGKYVVQEPGGPRTEITVTSPAGKTTAPITGATKRARLTTRRTTKPVSIDAAAVDAYSATHALRRLVNALGRSAVAQLLGVSDSQPGRWLAGTDRLSQANEQAVLDLDFVLSLLLTQISPAAAGVWLVSANAHLGGARPVDALALRGQAPVAAAIQSLAAGAFA